MKTRLIILSLGLLIIGCKNSMLVEKNESLLQSDFKQMKVVCIDPRFYYNHEEENYNLERLGNLTSGIKKDIEFSARKNHIELNLFDLSNLSSDSYQDLLPLKQNLLEANFNQSSPIDNNTWKYRKKDIQQKVFVYPPKISYEFGSLSQKYGTPLFSYLGVYYVGENMVLYHVVVNTDRGETIYRENRIVKGKVNSGKIAQMIYDSYAILAKELKKN